MADSDCARVCRSTTITVVSTAMASTTITVRTHRRMPGLAPAPRGWGPCPVPGGVASLIGILGNVPGTVADQAGGTNPPAPFAGGVCSGPPSPAAPAGSVHAVVSPEAPATGDATASGPGPGDPGSGKRRPGVPCSGELPAGLTTRRACSLLRRSASTALR